MAVIPDFRKETLLGFLSDEWESGLSGIDGLKSFTGLKEAGFQHVPRSQPLRSSSSACRCYAAPDSSDDAP